MSATRTCPVGRVSRVSNERKLRFIEAMKRLDDGIDPADAWRRFERRAKTDARSGCTSAPLRWLSSVVGALGFEDDGWPLSPNVEENTVHAGLPNSGTRDRRDRCKYLLFFTCDPRDDKGRSFDGRVTGMVQPAPAPLAVFLE